MLIALLCTLPYCITISQLGNLDQGAVIGGYVGMVFLSAAYISVGLFASSLTQNQIVAFLIALFIGIFFHLLFDVIGSELTGPVGAFFSYLSIRTHVDSLSRGVIDSRDIVFFLSLILIGLVGRKSCYLKEIGNKMKKQKIIIQFLAIAGIILIANLLFNQLYFRLDFTEDKQYTLSAATKDILNDLDEVITVRAYFFRRPAPSTVEQQKRF